MGIGTWEPKQPADFSRENLQSLVGALDGESVSLAPEVAAANAVLMQQDAGAWAGAEGFDEDFLQNLIRFFTLAEGQVPGWEAGKRSPVIPLVRLLKARDAFDDDLRRWIKAHTDNRYLPYGSIF
ncbi:MAG: hypothetical protein CMQ24_10360 [Gammaproteobacteria bacterium]|nr:hypothetical protein [Gammaproteobacteria bacterium]